MVNGNGSQLYFPKESARTAIQRAIHDCLGLQHQNESLKFICEHELRDIWAGFSIGAVFSTASWTPSESQIIRADLLKVLSILILINWPELDELFRPVFFDRVNHGMKDASLPFPIEAMEGLENSKYMFFQEQYAFIPAVIEEHDEAFIQEIQPKIRLPFREKSLEIGTGGYGEVRKVEIAPRCLYSVHRKSDSPVPIAVACKLYKSDRSQDDFRKELENLTFLKESLLRQDRIMLHTAAIAHGTSFMILLPLAEHRDLELFLNCGMDVSMDSRFPERVYDFASQFPVITKDNLASALLKELTALASALKWLHEDLNVLDSQDLYCAHMDLKPKNILLKAEPQSVVGKWMISDFGISAFEKSTNRKEPHFQSIRETGSRVTSRAPNEAERGHGPFQPPEIHLRDQVDGRKCDVWSFGCVSAEVLAFALGKKSAVDKFRSDRFNGRDDYFYEASPSSATSFADRPRFQLRQGVKMWFESLTTLPEAPWVESLVSMIERILVIEPFSRPDAQEVWKGLKYVSQHISPVSRHTNDSPVSSRLPPRAWSPTSDPPPDGRNHAPTFASTFTSPTAIEVGSRSQDMFSMNRKRQSDSSRQSALSGPSSLPQSSISNSERSISSYEVISGDLTALPLINIPLPSGKITDMGLSPQGEKVGFLYPQHVFIYHISSDTIGDPSIVPLPAGTMWTKISMASHYVAAYGIGAAPKRLKKVVLCDVNRPARSLKIPSSCDFSLLSEIQVSSKGTIAFVCRNQISLLHLLENDTQRGELLEIATDYVINQTSFTGDGRWLCAWAIGTGPDQSYFWNLEDFPAKPANIGCYKKVRTASTDFRLFPCHTKPICMIREKRHGQAFVIEAKDSDHMKQRSRHPLGITDFVLACVAGDDTLFCVKKTKLGRKSLYEYTLGQRRDGSTDLTDKSPKLGSIKSNLDEKTSRATVITTESDQTIVICTIKGEIEKLSRSL